MEDPEVTSTPGVKPKKLKARPGLRGRLTLILFVLFIPTLAFAAFMFLDKAGAGPILPLGLSFSALALICFGAGWLLLGGISGSVTRLRDHARSLGREESQNLAIALDFSELQEIAESLNRMSEDVQNRDDDRVMAEAALRESEEHFRIVFNKAPVGAAVLGLDYRFWRSNETFREITGYSEKELTRFRLADLAHPEDLGSYIARIDESFREGAGNFRLEKRFIRKDGETIWVSVSGQVIRDSVNQPLHLVLLIEDITERMRMEIELRRSRDELESKVRERTAELRTMNILLEEDIAKRREIERELREALANVRTLSGMLPICSHCKKIRNDEGYWQQIESYIHQHSEAQFSHGICPECLKIHYAEILGDRLNRILDEKKPE